MAYKFAYKVQFRNQIEEILNILWLHDCQTESIYDLGEGAKKTEIKTNKCYFWPYIHTYFIKTNIFPFFSQATIKKHEKYALLGKKQK